MHELDCGAHYLAKAGSPQKSRVLTLHTRHGMHAKRRICKSFTSSAQAAGRRTLRIATRPSKLAMRQSEQVAELLKSFNLGHAAAQGAQDVGVQFLPMTTRGDMPSDAQHTAKPQNLLSMRDLGPGAFTAELDAAVLAGLADLSVHSLKDAPPVVPRGLVLGGCLPREDPRDCLLSLGLTAQRIRDIPAGTVIGTSSTRRRALLLASNPSLQVTSMRGNVDSRIDQMAAGQVDATILGISGLRRLNRTDVHYTPLPFEDMLPAACSGTVGVMVREDDVQLREMLQHLGDTTALLEATAERSLLAQLMMSQQGVPTTSSNGPTAMEDDQGLASQPVLQMPQHAVAALARCTWGQGGGQPCEGVVPPQGVGDLVMEAVVADVDGKWVRRVGGSMRGLSCQPDRWHDTLEAVRSLGVDLGQQLRLICDEQD